MKGTDDYKNRLNDLARELLQTLNHDRPAYRMALNDYADSLEQDIRMDLLRERITDEEAELMINELHDHCAGLHRCVLEDNVPFNE